MGVVDPGALPGVPATPTPSTNPAIPPPAPPTPVAAAPQPPTMPFDRPGDKDDKQTFQVSDCRSLVKTLVCGVKTITWGITSCKAPGGERSEICFYYSFGKQNVLIYEIIYSFSGLLSFSERLELLKMYTC